MEWFRPRLKLGAYLALVALALNLAFSFDHHHFSEITVDRPAAAEKSAGVDRAGEGDPDHQGPVAAHPCFTCVVVTAAAIAADPPALPAPAARQIIEVAAIASVESPASDRTVFEARAPPRS